MLIIDGRHGRACPGHPRLRAKRKTSRSIWAATRGSSPRASLTPFACLLHIVPFFADLVVIARSLYPIPSRTRPSKSSAPMVLSLKAWKSRSLPGLQRTEHPLTIFKQKSPAVSAGLFCFAKRVSILGIPWVAGTTRIGVRPDRGCGRAVFSAKFTALQAIGAAMVGPMPMPLDLPLK